MNSKAKKVDNKNVKKQVPLVVPNKKSFNSLILSIICFLFAFILYSNTIMHSYVYDDYGILAKNWVVAKGVQGIPILLKTTYWYGANIVLNTYRPLSQIMFAIEWQLSPNSPHLSHFINVLFYAISCLLSFLVLRKYLCNTHPLIPFLITLLYIVLPIHTEVVANIKSRDEIMSFFFLIVTLSFLHTWFTKRKWWSLIVSLLTFFLAFMSKEGVITMLFLFPVIGWYFTDAKLKTILIGSLLLIIPAITYVFIRHQVLSNYTVPFKVDIIENFLIAAPDASSHFATAVMLLGKYLLLSLIPYQLVCDYTYNQIPIIGLSNPLFILSMLIYLALVVYAIINFRKKSPIVFGIVFFLITVSMYSNILFEIVASFGERLMYLPSLGICIAVVSLLFYWMKVGINNKAQSGIELLKSKPLFTIIFIAVIMIFSIKTVVRAAEWKNETILSECDIKRSPNSAHMRFFRGTVLSNDANKSTDQSKKETMMLQAVAHFEKGIAILPTYADCYEKLGALWYKLKDNNKALFYFDTAVKLKPDNAITWNTMGIIYSEAGNHNKAMEYYKKAISLNPKYSNAYLNYGSLLGNLGRLDEAIIAFKKCIEFEPNNSKAYQFIGMTYQNLRNPEEANKWFQKADEIELRKKKTDESDENL